MAKFVYSMIASLDGYVEDAGGRFDWAAPDEEVHTLVNDLEQPIGTYLFGSKMYETIVFWERAGLADNDPEVIRDVESLWRGADKIVFSKTLMSLPTAQISDRAGLRCGPDPAAQADRQRGPGRRRRAAGRIGARCRTRRRDSVVPSPGGRRWRRACPAHRLAGTAPI